MLNIRCGRLHDSTDIDKVTPSQIQQLNQILSSPEYDNLINDYNNLIEVILSYNTSTKLQDFINFQNLEKNGTTAKWNFVPIIIEYKNNKFRIYNYYTLGFRDDHLIHKTMERDALFTAEQISEIFEINEMFSDIKDINKFSSHFSINIIGPIGTEYVSFTLQINHSIRTDPINSSEIETPGDLYKIIKQQL